MKSISCLALLFALSILPAVGFGQGAKKPPIKPAPKVVAPPAPAPVIFQSGPFDTTGPLNRKEVQVELKMTPQQIKDLKNAPGAAGRVTPEPGVRRKWVNKFLTIPQQVRFQEIILQRMGLEGIMHPEIAKAIGITNGQLNEMYKLIADVNEKSADLAVADMSGPERIRRGEVNKARVVPGLKKIMSPAQTAKWQKLLGKPFGA